jgi:hypothetical protein
LGAIEDNCSTLGAIEDNCSTLGAIEDNCSTLGAIEDNCSTLMPPMKSFKISLTQLVSQCTILLVH